MRRKLLLYFAFISVQAFAQNNLIKDTTYGNVKFVNDVSLGGHNCKSFRLVQDTFEHAADLSNVNFSNKILLANLLFKKTADLGESSFYKELNVGTVSFMDKISFGTDSFFAQVNFQKCSLKAPADFSSSVFLDNVRFDNINAYDTLYFRKTEFLGKASFINCQLNGSLIFDSSLVAKKLSFRGSRLGKMLFFNGVTFTDSATISFYNTVISDTIIFANIIKVPGEVDLLKANFQDPSRLIVGSDQYDESKRHFISFYQTDISRFRLDYFHFRLLLSNPFTKKMMSSDEISVIYEALLDNFKTRGQMESYENLDIEFHDYKWSKSKYFSWFRWIAHNWNMYGYKKWLVFYWAAAFIAFFTLINFFLLPFLLSSIYPFDPVGEDPGSKFSARFWNSFIYTAALFFLFSLKLEKLNLKHRTGSLYILIIYTLGLICLGYMTGFVLQK